MRTVVQHVIGSLVTNHIKNEADRRAAKLNLERDLNAKLRKALKTDSSGKHTFVIDSNYVQLLNAGGALDDILQAVPSGAEREWGRSDVYYNDEDYVDWEEYQSAAGPCEHKARIRSGSGYFVGDWGYVR